MNVIESIRTRRSIGKVKPDPVNPKWIEQILESATWAPNHYHTEPWKFFVLTGEGRRPLGRTLARIAKEKLDDTLTEEEERLFLKKQEQKPFRAPVVIAVATIPADPGEHPKVIRQEEFAAVSAAVQNMLLTAHALGLGAIWRSGLPTYHPKMKELFGLGKNDELMGFVYLGYPAQEASQEKRTHFTEKTTWIDSDVDSF